MTYISLKIEVSKIELLLSVLYYAGRNHFLIQLVITNMLSTRLAVFENGVPCDTSSQFSCFSNGVFNS